MVDTGSGPGRVFTSKSDEEVMREAEVMALRSISDNLGMLSKEMAFHREAMGTMREDMAAIKERQQQHSEVRESLKELATEFRGAMEKLAERFQQEATRLENRIIAVEERNLKQDGAMGFATLLKDFGPWLVAIVAGAWALLKR